MVSFYHKWGFCENGQLAANMNIKKVQRNMILEILIYEVASKQIVHCRADEHPAAESHGFYWSGDKLVLVYFNKTSKRMELWFYRLDLAGKQANCIKKTYFPCSLPVLLSSSFDVSLPFLDEIIIDGQAFSASMSTVNMSVTQFFLTPRSIHAKYPPKNYYCHFAKGRIVQDENGEGRLLTSMYPAISGTKLYCLRKFYYASQDKYKYELNKYYCIDLSKLQDVYGQPPIDFSTFLLMQDAAALTRKVMKRRGNEIKLDELRIISLGPNITSYKNHQYTIFQQPHGANNGLTLIFHLNLETECISIIKLKDKKDISVSRHPLGFPVVFFPLGTILDEPFATAIECNSILGMRTLKGIAAAKVFFDKNIDENTTKDLKFVLK